MNTPKPRRASYRLAIIVLAIACLVVALVDYWRFEGISNRIRQVSSELGGRVGSIGSWPLGKEYVIGFDQPITNGQLQRLVAAVPESTRFYVSLHFNCDVPDSRLAEISDLTAPDRFSISVAPPEEE